MRNLIRLGRHLFTPSWWARRRLPLRSRRAIESAIRQGEARHGGQIVVAVEPSLIVSDLFRGKTAREHAIDVFSRLRVWDTEYNNGVLIYLLLADRDVEIVADRGIDCKVQGGWEPICREMESAFLKDRFEEGVLLGVARVTDALARHFPRTGAGGNELPDQPQLL